MTDVPVNAGTQSSGAEPSLHRVMGPWLLLLFIVGDSRHRNLCAHGPGCEASGGRRLVAFRDCFCGRTCDRV
jgi:hypothetical protein